MARVATGTQHFLRGFVIYRLIAPEWALNEKRIYSKVLEGEFAYEDIQKYNKQGYNVYYLPNYPSSYETGVSVTGSIIDKFEWVFVDCDLKEGVYQSKEDFLDALIAVDIPPTKIVDSGNGVHAYWRVSNLEPMSYLRFQRRLMRLLHTDEAVGQLFQLMRLPGTINTKVKDSPKVCELWADRPGVQYTAEELDSLLPQITIEDEKYCQDHYNRTYGINQDSYTISDEIPAKFGKLLRDNKEVKELWSSPTDDRSKNDFRLGHIMFATGFTKEEAASVLVNSAKALQRAPTHRSSYASNIIDKIWTFELTEDKDKLELSSSVREILQKSGSALKGTPFRCHPRIDNTEHGFRLGQVIGLVAGSGVGKTAFALNMFQWFVQTNPDYHHFFIPLEQPANEIADRWKTMCGPDSSLHDKVHVISNYDDEGNFRHLSFDEIREYIEKFQKTKNIKVGCIVIDHIGALKKKGKDGENQDLMDICHSMKAFAIQTNTLLVMQSQSSREKAGIGDLELNKDAAYGTVYFESYCDYLITLWQPLKRCHNEEACPTVTAFKFCKIRHKKARKDVIQEDVAYYMYFDSETEQLRDITQAEKISFDFFLPKAVNKRKVDRKVDIIPYQSVQYK
jgi:hypothetical protein